MDIHEHDIWSALGMIVNRVSASTYLRSAVPRCWGQSLRILTCLAFGFPGGLRSQVDYIAEAQDLTRVLEDSTMVRNVESSIGTGRDGHLVAAIAIRDSVLCLLAPEEEGRFSLRVRDLARRQLEPRVIPERFIIRLGCNADGAPERRYVFRRDGELGEE